MNLEDILESELIKVTAKKAGFRRAGVSWPDESIVPVDAFDEAQWEVIYNEPMLVVSMPDDAEYEAWAEEQEKINAAKEAATKDSGRPENEDEAKQQIIDAIKAIGGEKKPTVKDVNEKLEGWKTNGEEIKVIWAELNKD